jgi:hypothetical protein
MDGGGSGNASGGSGGASTCCYYALLGIRKNASATDIRAAYRRLAMVSSVAVHARAASRRCLIALSLSLSVCSPLLLLPNRHAHTFRSIAVGAQKWHPDRWASDPGAAGEANQRFQRIQEAYSGKAYHSLRVWLCLALGDLIEYCLFGWRWCSSVGQGEEGHVRRRALRPPRRRRPGESAEPRFRFLSSPLFLLLPHGSCCLLSRRNQPNPFAIL